MAVSESNALAQQRQAEHLAQQLRQREAELAAKQAELERETIGRKLAESQHARAEDTCRQDTERAQRALEVDTVSSYALLALTLSAFSLHLGLCSQREAAPQVLNKTNSQDWPLTIVRPGCVQDYRSRAETELGQAHRNLSSATADLDALKQKWDQLAADLASSNSVIKDLQSDLRRAKASEKAGHTFSLSSHVVLSSCAALLLLSASGTPSADVPQHERDNPSALQCDEVVR